jgi:hypothetical protein
MLLFPDNVRGLILTLIILPIFYLFFCKKDEDKGNKPVKTRRKRKLRIS